MNRTLQWLPLALLCMLLPGLRAFAAEPAEPMIFHLPGIGGHLLIDDMLLEGLQQGHLSGKAQILDWTMGNPGIPALGGYERNKAQAAKIAMLLADAIRNNPNRRIIVTTHSGGAGLAVWALESLPDGLKIDTLAMIAPALSPKYDLSAALKHVRSKAYSFNSLLDPILGFGTRNLGTIDRVFTESAGCVGFSPPPNADLKEYQKLSQIPYDDAWLRLGNAGDHIGAMNRPFARTIIAPLLLTGQLPRYPSTRPSSQPVGQ